MNLQQLLMDSIDIQDICSSKYRSDMRMLHNHIDTLIREDYKHDIDKIKKMYKLIKVVESDYIYDYLTLKINFKILDMMLIKKI